MCKLLCLGMEDHSSLRLTPETPRLWSTVYLDLALRLAANVRKTELLLGRGEGGGAPCRPQATVVTMPPVHDSPVWHVTRAAGLEYRQAQRAAGGGLAQRERLHLFGSWGAQPSYDTYVQRWIE